MQHLPPLRHGWHAIGATLLFTLSLSACDAGNTPKPRTGSTSVTPPANDTGGATQSRAPAGTGSTSGGAGTSGMAGSGAAAGSGGSADERR